MKLWPNNKKQKLPDKQLTDNTDASVVKAEATGKEDVKPRSKKKLLIAIITLVMLVLVALGLWSWLKKPQKPEPTEAAEQSFEQELAEAVQESDKIVAQHRTEIEEEAKAIRSVEDLSKLSEEDQAKVGLIAANILLDSDDTQAAIDICQHLMKRNDTVGLRAAVYCYSLSKGEVKQSSYERANQLARQFKIIGQDESLPDSYFNPKEQG